jgi:hypothetical protein
MHRHNRHTHRYTHNTHRHTYRYTHNTHRHTYRYTHRYTDAHTDSHMCTDTCYTKHTLLFMWKKTVVLSDNDGTHIFSH